MTWQSYLLLKSTYYLIYFSHVVKLGSAPGRRGGGLKTFYTGRLHFEVQPFYPCIPFLTERVPLLHTYLPLTNGTSFTSTCLELRIPFNCCKCTVFKICITYKPKRLLTFSQQNMHLLALLGLSQI